MGSPFLCLLYLSYIQSPPKLVVTDRKDLEDNHTEKLRICFSPPDMLTQLQKGKELTVDSGGFSLGGTRHTRAGQL